MNVWVLIAIAAGLVGLRVVDLKVRRVHILVWIAVWPIVTYVTMRYGIVPPVPSSVVWMFIGIVALSLLAYLSADSERLRSAEEAVVAFVTERRYLVPLVIVVLLLPALVALRVYLDQTAAPQPPVSGRTIHPPPPNQISFQGETIDLVTAVNPYRRLEESDPEQFAEHVENGRRIYFENCVYCHGDDMEGRGLFAHGFDPIPANFRDATTIAMLQESYLFWRIAKGGPGLPSEATPWSSAMPAWEPFLSEEEIWDVILFLYEYTGHRPRAKEHVEEGGH